jgi:hypothetical protein
MASDFSFPPRKFQPKVIKVEQILDSMEKSCSSSGSGENLGKVSIASSQSRSMMTKSIDPSIVASSYGSPKPLSMLKKKLVRLESNNFTNFESKHNSAH